MGIKNLLVAFAKKKRERPTIVDTPDDVTTDRYLRSLRRQRRRQIEEGEKKLLIKKIAEFHKVKTRKELWGIKERVAKKKALKGHFLNKGDMI